MFALAALVALLLPLGPMFDHHFAERLPYHAHIGAPGGHEHGYRHLHAHDAERPPDWSPALYNLDTSPTVLTLVLLTAADLDGGLIPNPESALRIPQMEHAPLRSAYLPPPYRPPINSLPVPASL